MINNGDHNGGLFSDFKDSLCKCPISPKVLIFSWISVKDKILTEEKIRGWIGPSTCCLCCSAEVTVVFS